MIRVSTTSRFFVIETLLQGGWMMAPIVLCSVIAMTIGLERLWALRLEKVLPQGLISEVHRHLREDRVDEAFIRSLRTGSPLGAILAAALATRHLGPEAMRDATEHAGRQTSHELERYLNALGTIAQISPYLGLLGSVLGMIRVFQAFATQDAQGILQDPTRLAGGISEILVATAGGLIVAIPTLILYRFLRGRITELTVRLEEEAAYLIATLRRPEEKGAHSP